MESGKGEDQLEARATPSASAQAAPTASVRAAQTASVQAAPAASAQTTLARGSQPGASAHGSSSSRAVTGASRHRLGASASPGPGSQRARASGPAVPARETGSSSAAGRTPTSPTSMPGPGGLAGGQSPPFILPGEHFAAALVCWVLGGLGLVWIAPDLVSGLFPLPRVVAVTHLFTLGWITLSILGALYQFMPVALGVPVRWEWLGHAVFVLYVPGLTAFVLGLVQSWPTVMVGGAAMFSAALLLFVLNLVFTLARATERGLTWWSLVGAAVSLVLTVVLGMVLATNHGTGWLGGERFAGVGVHMHVALAGWVLMVVIGVAHRLLPMFLLSHGASEWPGRVAAALVAGGVLLLSALYAIGRADAYGVAALMIGGGATAFLIQGMLFYRHSIRPGLDAGMRLAGGALGFLGLGLAIAPFALTRGLAAPSLLVAYTTTLLIGAFGLFIAAHYYKILPFLVWYHRIGPLIGKRPVPQVADLYSSRVAHSVAVCLVVGVLGLILSIMAGAPAAARASALVFVAGTALQATQLLKVALRRYA